MPKQQGELNSSARLTEEQVRAIRRDHDVLTRRELAEQYGVTTAMICLIVKRKRWAHVDG